MMLWRHLCLVFFFLTACLGLAVRVVYLNVTDREFLQDQGNARSVRDASIPAYRGVVYDRLGEPLAVSTPVYEIWTDPVFDQLADDDVERLAGLLEFDPRRLSADLKKNASRRYMSIKRSLPWEVAEQLKALHIKGVHLSSEYRRFYPASETASHVVGVTGVSDSGLEGIELSFNETLRGEAGRKVILIDGSGRSTKDLDYLSAPRFGRDLTLSLDLRLQFLAFRELKAVVESHRAASGSLVMLDALTGEILVLVSQPAYNPNDPEDRSPRAMRNRAVTDTYEPGSTIKPFTALAALESEEFTRNTMIETSPGYLRVRRKTFQDPRDYGTISLETVLKKSSQVGIVKVALSLEDRAVFDVLSRSGVGEYPGTGLPGEAAGTLIDSGLSNPLVKATLAFGYGLAVSPLQLAQAYLTLASGGVRIPISILRQEQAPVGVRVFDEAMTRDVVSMMEGVTAADGTAPKAHIEGYRVAGKSGTVRKVGQQGYDDERHVAWFAGMAPASNPRIVAVVLVNEPKGETYGGGAVAGPVFGQVVGRALRLLGVPPDETIELAAAY